MPAPQVHWAKTAHQTATARAVLSVDTITAAGIRVKGRVNAAMDMESLATVRKERVTATMTKIAMDH